MASLRTITVGFVDGRWSLLLFGFSFLPSSFFVGSCCGGYSFSSGFRGFAGCHHEQCLGGELMCKLVLSVQFIRMATSMETGEEHGASGARGDDLGFP